MTSRKTFLIMAILLVAGVGYLVFARVIAADDAATATSDKQTAQHGEAQAKSQAKSLADQVAEV